MNFRSSIALLVFVSNVSCSGDVRIVGEANDGGATHSDALGTGASHPGTTMGGTTSLAGSTGGLGGVAGLGGSAAIAGSLALGGSTSVTICPNSVGPGLTGQSCNTEGYACEFAGSPCGGFMRCVGGSWKQETACPSGTGGKASGGWSSQGGGTSSTIAAGTGGLDCSCVRGAYVPVCGSDGVTYDAACGDACVRVPIACRHQCPCTSGSGGATNGGGAGSVSTGGTPATGTGTGYGGLCNSGCSLAQVTIANVCQQNQELVTCTSSPNPNLSTILSSNGCTDSGLDLTAFCCPTAIETQCM